MCLTAVFMGMLNARGYFFIPALGATLLNVVMIATVLLVAPQWGQDLGDQIFALAFGVSASGRQIYLQNIPKDELAAGYCDTPFYLLFDMYPFFDAMSKVFQGSSKCAEDSWSLLGLNIAEWSMVFFASMISLMLVRYLLIILKGHRYN